MANFIVSVPISNLIICHKRRKFTSIDNVIELVLCSIQIHSHNRRKITSLENVIASVPRSNRIFVANVEKFQVWTIKINRSLEIIGFIVTNIGNYKYQQFY